MDDKQLRSVIEDALLELGIPDSLLGFPRLTTAIAMLVKDPDRGMGIYKGLLVDVAKIHGTTISRAERNMRHCVDLAFERGDWSVFKKWFGNSIDPMTGKPSLKMFLCRVANKIRRDMEDM